MIDFTKLTYEELGALIEAGVLVGTGRDGDEFFFDIDKSKISATEKPKPVVNTEKKGNCESCRRRKRQIDRINRRKEGKRK